MPTGTLAPADVTITALGGEERTMAEWVTMFHLVVIAIDPYTNESAWLLPTAVRVLSEFQGADCRVAWLVTGPPADAQRFLGPWARDILTLVDPDRSVVKALGLTELPALVHIGTDLVIRGVAEGWQPAEWNVVTAELAKVMSWSKPKLPSAGDPGPFKGSPAAGS